MLIFFQELAIVLILSYFQISGPEAFKVCFSFQLIHYSFHLRRKTNSNSKLFSPQAAELLLRNQTLPAMRTAAKRKIFSPTTGEVVDEGLVLLFPGIGCLSIVMLSSSSCVCAEKKSVTGEPVVELHLHGSRAVSLFCQRLLSLSSLFSVFSLIAFEGWPCLFNSYA